MCTLPKLQKHRLQAEFARLQTFLAFCTTLWMEWLSQIHGFIFSTSSSVPSPRAMHSARRLNPRSVSLLNTSSAARMKTALKEKDYLISQCHGLQLMLVCMSDLLSDINCGWAFVLKMARSSFLSVRTMSMALSTDRSSEAISATSRADDFFK